MDVCYNNHEEIVYTERHCPMCILSGEKEELESKIEDLNKEITDLTDELNNRE